jgi:hypothetical protein
MEILVIFLLVALIAFLTVHTQTQKKRRRKMALSEAWRIVLDDPNYEHRRRYEETLREDDLRLKKEHAFLRKKEGLSGEVPPELSNE